MIATVRGSDALTVLVLIASTAATGWLEFSGAMVCHAVATACYLYVALRVVPVRTAMGFLPLALAAVVLRAVCLPHPISLSDDVYRYLHEGAVVLAGENPYAMAPAEVPIELRGEYWERINNPDIAAAYPPAVQLALALGAWLSPHPIGMKVVFGGLDLLVFVVLWLGLPVLGAARRYAAIHGLCPLLAIEFAGQAHSDSLAVLATVTALVAAAAARHRLAGGALAIAAAAKLVPAVLLPAIARGRTMTTAITFVAVLAALYLPFLTDPGALFGGTLEYVGRWRSNDSLFWLVHAATEQITARGWFDTTGNPWLQEPQRLAKLPLLAGGTLLLAACYRRRVAPATTAFWFFVYLLAAAPTVHPWYVAFLVPFLCLRPNPGLLAFTGTVFLAYHVLPGWIAERRWEERTWVKVIEYVPFYAGILHELWGRDSRPAAPSDR